MLTFVNEGRSGCPCRMIRHRRLDTRVNESVLLQVPPLKFKDRATLALPERLESQPELGDEGRAQEDALHLRGD